MGRSKCHLWRKLNQTCTQYLFSFISGRRVRGQQSHPEPRDAEGSPDPWGYLQVSFRHNSKKRSNSLSPLYFFVLLPSELPPLKSLGEKSHLSFRAALSRCPETKIGSRRFSRFGNRILFRGHRCSLKEDPFRVLFFPYPITLPISIPPSYIYTILSLNINGTSVRPSRSTCYLKGNSWNRVNGLIWMCPFLYSPYTTFYTRKSFWATNFFVRFIPSLMKVCGENLSALCYLHEY